MDICNITIFRDALLSPRTKLKSVNDIEPDIESLHRTTHFAECHATLHGTPVIIYAPISTQAVLLLQRACVSLHAGFDNDSTKLKLLHNEIANPLHGEHRYTLAIEYLKAECTLREILPFGNRQRLLSALDRLDAKLRHYDISINNLSLENIIVDESGDMHPIRQYYATKGYGGDNDPLALIRTKIEQEAPDSQPADNTLHEAKQSYMLHSTSRMVIEDRCAVESNERWGFETHGGELVIAYQYLWVSDFAEGRAMVMNECRMMGLIDKSGHAVIPVMYEIVEYDHNSGNSWVRSNQQWALFDYCGVQITDWHDREECRIEL